MTLTTTQQSQIRASLNNALNALLNHITIFFTNPPPRELPAHLLSPIPATLLSSNPSTPITEAQGQSNEAAEWSFLPRYSSALATCKWGLLILETLAKRVAEFVSWGEDTADAIRIAIGGIRERIVRATLVTWRDGTLVSDDTDKRCGTFLRVGGLDY